MMKALKKEVNNFRILKAMIIKLNHIKMIATYREKNKSYYKCSRKM